jgi:excisionase family DNA binding protein
MAQANIRTATPSPVPVLTVTVKTAAEITGLSRSTILRRAAENELRTILCGHRRLVDLTSLKKLVGVTDAP